MKHKLSDNDIWPIVREAAAQHGWDNLDAAIPAALREICGRFGIEHDTDRDVMNARLHRLWVERLEVMGAG